MKTRKRAKRIIISCVSVAITAAGAWALSVVPGLVTDTLDTTVGTLIPDASAIEYGTATPAHLERVVDGDTIVIRQDDESLRVRIIGIDAPELGRGEKADACYAQEATATLTAALSAGPIELVADPSQGDTDKYGRLLRHVTVNGQSVAVTMLAAGMGHEYTYKTPYVGLADHQVAEAVAQEPGAGLWSACQ